MSNAKVRKRLTYVSTILLLLLLLLPEAKLMSLQRFDGT